MILFFLRGFKFTTGLEKLVKPAAIYRFKHLFHFRSIGVPKAILEMKNISHMAKLQV